jgi:hypothetical protein
MVASIIQDFCPEFNNIYQFVLASMEWIIPQTNDYGLYIDEILYYKLSS